jgi:AraC-like DNA-binding protein
MKDRIAALEYFLLDRIKTRSLDPIIGQAIKRISESHGLVRMKALCQDLCLSQDAFEKRFRKCVGATPKQFANIVRMRSVLQQKSPDLAQVAYDHEFYDPSHFSKSFKQFTGKSPSAFFRKPSFW